MFPRRHSSFDSFQTDDQFVKRIINEVLTTTELISEMCFAFYFKEDPYELNWYGKFLEGSNVREVRVTADISQQGNKTIFIDVVRIFGDGMFCFTHVDIRSAIIRALGIESLSSNFVPTSRCNSEAFTQLVNSLPPVPLTEVLSFFC